MQTSQIILHSPSKYGGEWELTERAPVVTKHDAVIRARAREVYILRLQLKTFIRTARTYT